MEPGRLAGRRVLIVEGATIAETYRLPGSCRTR